MVSYGILLLMIVFLAIIVCGAMYIILIGLAKRRGLVNGANNYRHESRSK